MALPLWFIVRGLSVLAHFALAIASIAAFVGWSSSNLDENSSTPNLPWTPWASFSVSAFATLFNLVIGIVVFQLRRPGRSTEESRRNKRFYVLVLSALFTLIFAAVDAAFAAVLAGNARDQQGAQGTLLAACALAAIACVAAFVAFATDARAMMQERGDSKGVAEMERYQNA